MPRFYGRQEGRLFFKGIPQEPTCSSCGNPNVRKFNVDFELLFCDEICFIDWFVEYKSEEYAKKLAQEYLYDVD